MACKRIYTPFLHLFELLTRPQQPDPEKTMLDISSFALEYLVSHSPYTEKAYRSDLGKFQKFLEEEGLAAEAVRPIHIRHYITWLSYRRNCRTRGRGLSEDTVRRHIAAVRAYYEWLRFSNPHLSDPTAFFHFRRGEEPRKVQSIPGQFLDTMCDPHLATREEIAIVLLFRRSGIRLSELVGANRNALEVIPGTARIPLHGRLLVRGKGSKTRTVLISDDALEALRDYLLERKDRNPALFVSVRNQRISRRTVQRVIARLGAASGCHDAHPHRIRHGYAEDMLDNDMQLEVLRILMGHDRLETTIRYVNKLDRSTARQYHAAMEMIHRREAGLPESAKSRSKSVGRPAKPRGKRAA